MAAVTTSGARTCHGTTTTTAADSFALTAPVKSLRITNRSTTALFVTITTSTVSSTDDAGIVTAVASADETFVVPGLTTSGVHVTKELWRSPRASYLRGSVVGSASAYSIEGFDWY